MRLLRLSQPRDDENFLGHLLKLSEINHFGKIGWLIQLAGLRTNAFTNLSKKLVYDKDIDLSGLSELADTPQEALRLLRYPYINSGKMVSFYGQHISIHALNPLHPKICPACLSDSNYARKVWDLAMATFCPFHGNLLIDHCPSCGKRIDWYRKGVSKCRCEFDFRSIKPVKASEEGSQIFRIIHSILGYDVAPPFVDTPLADLSLNQLCTVVSFFSSYLAHQRTDTSGKTLGRDLSVAQLHQNLADVVKLFCDWPRNFINFLQTTDFKPAKNAKFGLYHRFGIFYPSFKHLFLNDQFEFIRNAFEKYQLKYFSKGYVRHQNLKIEDAYQKAAYLSKTEAAKQLKTSESWVDRLIETGKLDGIRVRSNNKHMILIKKTSVQRLHNRYKNLLSLSAVKKVLRIKSKTVIALINNDLLSCERGPAIDGYAHWRFSIHDLEQLLIKMESSMPPQRMGKKPSDLITFSETRQLLSAYQFSTLDFYRCVVSGQLKPYLRRDMMHVDSFLFIKSAVKKWIIEQHQKLYLEGYTMKQFKDLIGVSLDAVYEMEKEGLIKARYSGIPKLGKVIDKEAAEQFHSTYVSSTELAKLCSVNGSTVIKYLSRAGIRPVHGPSIDGTSRYFYLRKDFLDFDFKCIKPSSRAKSRKGPSQASLFDEAA